MCYEMHYVDVGLVTKHHAIVVILFCIKTKKKKNEVLTTLIPLSTVLSYPFSLMTREKQVCFEDF
jgi:hypothetical protein